jgi:L,D-transpeptidase YbiS
MNKGRLISILLVFFVLFMAVEGIGYFIAFKNPPSEGKAKMPSQAQLRAKNQRLRAALSGLTPKGIHIVVDTAENILLLKNGDRVIRKAVVSSGSGNVLEDPSGKRVWIFDTPRGEFKIESKAKNPNWIKPDWAFIEEGEDIPKSFKERVEEGVLGDYALGFGKGYFVHGTLYTRLLGRNVTHGCVRVGDDDLKVLYETVPIGAKIYLF